MNEYTLQKPPGSGVCVGALVNESGSAVGAGVTGGKIEPVKQIWTICWYECVNMNSRTHEQPPGSRRSWMVGPDWQLWKKSPLACASDGGGEIETVFAASQKIMVRQLLHEVVAPTYVRGEHARMSRAMKFVEPMVRQAAIVLPQPNK